MHTQAAYQKNFLYLREKIPKVSQKFKWRGKEDVEEICVSQSEIFLPSHHFAWKACVCPSVCLGECVCVGLGVFVCVWVWVLSVSVWVQTAMYYSWSTVYRYACPNENIQIINTNFLVEFFHFLPGIDFFASFSARKPFCVSFYPKWCWGFSAQFGIFLIEINLEIMGNLESWITPWKTHIGFHSMVVSLI